MAQLDGVPRECPSYNCWARSRDCRGGGNPPRATCHSTCVYWGQLHAQTLCQAQGGHHEVEDTALISVIFPSCWGQNSPLNSHRHVHAHGEGLQGFLYPLLSACVWAHAHTHLHPSTNVCGHIHPHRCKRTHPSVPRNTQQSPTNSQTLGYLLTCGHKHKSILLYTHTWGC